MSLVVDQSVWIAKPDPDPPFCIWGVTELHYKRDHNTHELIEQVIELQKKIEEMEKKYDELYYCPGFPGSIVAEKDFVERKRRFKECFVRERQRSTSF